MKKTLKFVELGGESAQTCLKKEFDTAIPSGCVELDKALNNGIKFGAITEFAGFSGSGKTQICLQLCVNCTIPGFKSLDGESIFIDTKNSVFKERVAQIAESGLKRIHASSNIGKALIEDCSKDQISKILEKIHYKNVFSLSELTQVMQGLRKFVAEKKKIRLIVIDSFSYLFRSFENMLKRMKVIYVILTELQMIADKFKCAIVITNEITTRLFNKDSCIVPALGESFHHRVTQRIILGFTKFPDIFCAQIEKNLWNPKSEVYYEISKDGIGDCPEEKLSQICSK